MTTHILSMTYEPKIEAVFSGQCAQTIRLVRSDVPWTVGDKLILRTWKGRPYATPWGRRLDTILNETFLIYLERGEGWRASNDPPFVRKSYHVRMDEREMDILAQRDGIVPPLASCLTNTLMALNNLTYEQMYEAFFRVIRWPVLSIRAARGKAEG